MLNSTAFSIRIFVFRFSPNWDRWTTTGEGMRCEIYRPASSLARTGEQDADSRAS